MYANITKINMQDKYNIKKKWAKNVMVNKSINTYQNKGHKQIIMFFCGFFRKKYRNKTKL